MKAHGGQIGMRSDGEGREGSGSTFYVDMPASFVKQQRLADIECDFVDLEPASTLLTQRLATVAASIDGLLPTHPLLLQSSDRLSNCSQPSSHKSLCLIPMPLSGPEPQIVSESMRRRRSSITSILSTDTYSTTETSSLTSNITTSVSVNQTIIDIAGSLRLLIVDNSHVCRNMTKRLLSNSFFSVDQACDGLEAVHKCSSYRASQSECGHKLGKGLFDVIVMDSEMPRMCGADATRLIREGGFSGLIVGFTGDQHKDCENEFLLAGANRVMLKPLDVDKLLAWLSEKFAP